MGHENGKWMNDEQKNAMKDAATKELKVRAVSLKGAIAYGLENGKRNMIVDVDLLSEILAGHVPVGNNELSPEDVTALLYEVKKKLADTTRELGFANVRGDQAEAALARMHAAQDAIPNRRNFGDELTCLLNKYSKENGSNTPDFILAEYLTQQLEAWNLAIRAREEWYGRKFSGGSLASPSDDRESFARQCFGNFFTRGKWAKEVLPTEEIEAAIGCILKSDAPMPITLHENGAIERMDEPGEIPPTRRQGDEIPND